MVQILKIRQNSGNGAKVENVKNSPKLEMWKTLRKASQNGASLKEIKPTPLSPNDKLFVRTKKLHKNTVSQARLVVFYWFYKGWSHFGILFRPVLAKYIGLRNDGSFLGHFFSKYLMFHWYCNRICVIRSPFLVGYHILARL